MGRGKKENNAIVVSGKFTVDNRIVRAKYGKLTDTEFRLVFTLIAKIKKDDLDFKTYEYTTGELLRELGISETNYTYLLDVLESVFKKSISIPDGKGGYTLYHWLETAHVSAEKKIVIRFNDDLKPFLIQLQNRFTQIGFQYFSILSSVYHRRIYMFCKEALGINYGKPCALSMTFDELREILELPKSYESAKYVKRDILTPAIEDINDRSDIKIAIEYIQSGRTYTGIKILATSKQTEALPELPANTASPKKLSAEYILQFVEKAELDRYNKSRASRVRKFLKLPVWEQKYWTDREESDMFKSPLLGGVKDNEQRLDLLLGFASLRWWEDKKAKAAKKKDEQESQTTPAA